MNSRTKFLISTCLLALLINVLLASWKFIEPSGGIVGCGDGTGCADVLTSLWSQVFGLPVAILGAIVYILLYAALLWEKPRGLAICYGLIAGAAVWLIFVQAVILRQFCPWCMAAHGVGFLIVIVGLSREKFDEPLILSFLIGIVVSLCLPLGQLYGPAPSTSAVSDMANNGNRASLDQDIRSVGKGRKVRFHEGKMSYDCSSLPLIGSADADHVLVEFFDFQCPACRTMNDYLTALVEKHPRQVSILVLPVPLDHDCNSALPPDEPGHPGSCDLARIALAVWRTRPELYPMIHQKLISEPPLSLAAAFALARAQLGEDEFEKAMTDPWIADVIKANIADWVSIAGNRKILPQLLITEKRVLHGLPSGKEDFIRVMEKELGL